MNNLLLPSSTEHVQHIKWALIGVTLSWVVAALLACGSTPTATGHSLYDQLGGQSNLERVVNRTMDRVSSDPKTKRSFQGIKMPALKKSVTDYLCKVADGPCVYEGETMAKSHDQANITASEFDGMVTVLREELDRANVPEAAKNELLRRLAPTRREIVKNL